MKSCKFTKNYAGFILKSVKGRAYGRPGNATNWDPRSVVPQIVRRRTSQKNTAIVISEIKSKGMNRARGEALETVHHLFTAKLKGYEDEPAYEAYRKRYKECIRMLNGLEKKLETQLPERERRWFTSSTAERSSES